MAQVVWTYRAAKDLLAIEGRIAQDRPIAATGLAGRIRALAESLVDYPDRGRPIAAGLRELASIRPYVIRYRVIGDTVHVTRIRHAARRPLP